MNASDKTKTPLPRRRCGGGRKHFRKTNNTPGGKNISNTAVAGKTTPLYLSATVEVPQRT